MRVRRDFPLQLARLVNHRFQLFERVLRRADRVSFRQHATSGARLNYVSTVLDLVANRGADLLRSVGNTLLDSRIEQTRSKTILIAVAATHPDRMSGAHHSWSRRPAFVDGLPQS